MIRLYTRRGFILNPFLWPAPKVASTLNQWLKLAQAPPLESPSTPPPINPQLFALNELCIFTVLAADILRYIESYLQYILQRATAAATRTTNVPPTAAATTSAVCSVFSGNAGRESF